MKARVVLNWHLWTKCPYCGYDFDLADFDEDGQWSKPIFSNNWHELEGEEIQCPQCSAVASIEEVVY